MIYQVLFNGGMDNGRMADVEIPVLTVGVEIQSGTEVYYVLDGPVCQTFIKNGPNPYLALRAAYKGKSPLAQMFSEFREELEAEAQPATVTPLDQAGLEQVILGRSKETPRQP